MIINTNDREVEQESNFNALEAVALTAVLVFAVAAFISLIYFTGYLL